MLLLDATAPEDRRQEILAEVQATIADGGGAVAEVHDWGNRRLTFEIDHRPEADYKLLQFEGDNDLLARLNASLRIMDGVLRFRIIRQQPGGPPVPPRPEPVYAGGPADEPEGRVAARAAADAAPEVAEPVEPVDDAPAEQPADAE
jgi:small subunit ribosomal protein S6